VNYLGINLLLLGIAKEILFYFSAVFLSEVLVERPPGVYLLYLV
jgi:hypothetical protein